MNVKELLYIFSRIQWDIRAQVWLSGDNLRKVKKFTKIYLCEPHVYYFILQTYGSIDHP